MTDFYPRSPRGERPLGLALSTAQSSFLSTLPARGATFSTNASYSGLSISIHAPREGSDRKGLPSSPVRSGISIHAPREGSDILCSGIAYGWDLISIHAPREGSDLLTSSLQHDPHGISIHAPREGSDMLVCCGRGAGGSFLSTLPARGATRDAQRTMRRCMEISIHAPREGSDPEWSRHSSPIVRFLSTLPARGATHHAGRYREPQLISIHAPREGSDGFQVLLNVVMEISIHAPREGSDPASRLGKAATSNHFYPRSPRGERPLFFLF